MARNKKGKSTPPSRDPPRSGQQSSFLSSNFVRSSNAQAALRDQKHFSLLDAARSSRSRWDSQTTTFRHSAINFVSSANAELSGLEGTFTPAPSENDDAESLNRPSNQSPVSTPAQRPPSVAPSDSSDEIVLFAGRRNPSLKNLNNTASKQAHISPSSHSHSRDLKKSSPSCDASAPVWAHDAELHQTERQKEDRAVAPQIKGENGSPLIYPDDDHSDGEGGLSDYVANMRDSGEINAILEQATLPERGLAREANASLADITRSNLDVKHDNPLWEESGWRTTDLEDLGDLSTSEEMLQTVSLVLANRERPNGKQYLIVWEGQSIDEARWIPQSSLTMPSAIELIKAFEETEKQAHDSRINDSEEDANEAEGEDEDENENENEEVLSSENEMEDYLDQRDLLERRTAGMADEEIARLLSKQEEIGLGSEELILFDDGGDDFGDFGMNGTPRPKLGRKDRRKHEHRAKRSQNRPFMLREDILAQEQLDDFDLMDHERPSLIRKPREKDRLLDLALSDSDLERTLQDTFAADRRKKRLQKQEREELRAQGLLGKKDKHKPDLASKYRNGISMDEIGELLREFLLSPNEYCALPPMDKRERKIVHEIGHAFKLNSKSSGSGQKRFPVLYKTSRAQVYDEAVFSMLNAQLNRRFFHTKSHRGMGITPPKRGGGAGAPDISYRDGEIVGASAPELGADNKGRAMLEKMGWSSGTALGALNNKGILQPVTHVVKNSKAGLG